MSTLLEPTVLLIIGGCLLLGASAGTIGVFSYLQKKALFSDALAHAVLPGVALAFMVSGQKNPLYLIIGALLSGWLALLSIDIISKHSKIKPDTAIGISLSLFFGIGILLLTHIQQSGEAAQSGLDSFLFGKAASMQQQDVLVFATFAVILLILVVLFFKEFKLLTFNRDFAVSIGLPVLLFDFLLSTLNVLAVAIGIQSVGVVLMSALLITPASAARFWTSDLKKMVLIACFIGAASGVIGCLISISAPGMPTGPWIVVVLTAIVSASIFFAPKTGIVSRNRRNRLHHQKINRENILKTFYHLGEARHDFSRTRQNQELTNWREFSPESLQSGLKQLTNLKLIERKGKDTILTPLGLIEAKRVVRLHRLWELYLTKRLHLPSDHVHHNAELMEHIITPEIEALLLNELDHPTTDPHNSKIPT